MAGQNAKYYVRIGGAVGDVGEARYGFSAPDYAYDGIGDELNVIKLSDNNSARGILFGANRPKPPRVRLSGIDPNLGSGAANDRPVSAIRFCDPDRVGRVLGGNLNDTVCKTRGGEFLINSATMA